MHILKRLRIPTGPFSYRGIFKRVAKNCRYFVETKNFKIFFLLLIVAILMPLKFLSSFNKVPLLWLPKFFFFLIFELFLNFFSSFFSGSDFWLRQQLEDEKILVYENFRILFCLVFLRSLRFFRFYFKSDATVLFPEKVVTDFKNIYILWNS